jgi:hypothetical protein
VQHLSSGIDLPDMTVDSLKRRVKAALPAGELVFHCETSKGPGLPVRCIAMLPPSFIEYALRNGARRVKAIGCEGECAYRLGMELAEERFSRMRMPRLRPNVRYSRSGHEYSFDLR